MTAAASRTAAAASRTAAAGRPKATSDRGSWDRSADRPVRLDRDARCVVLYIVKILNLLGSGIVTRSLRIGRRTGRHQGEHGKDNYEDVIRNAAASSLAFHGSPVSRLAGTAARYSLRRDSIIGKWQYKKNSVSFALVPAKACTYSPQSKSRWVKGEGFLAIVVASLESRQLIRIEARIPRQ